jgi:hypothetical protein
MFVRSFALGATKDDLNLVLWQWGDSLPSRLTLIDNENRLSTNGPEDVKRWLKFLKVERKLSDIRIRDGHFAAIRTVLNSARKAGSIATNVCDTVKPDAKPRPRTREKDLRQGELYAI